VSLIILEFFYDAFVFFAANLGSLKEEEEVLEWLRKNRYKHPELSFFMYGIGAITGAFILYTVFFMVCLKDNKKHENVKKE
jgi:hypothetical protein